ncbi:hypothetical protein FH972_026536 [Carpinus fangiana]|uniref:Uncharacterized protein n=1 Tax=Carpinus fangiana TaxID=176857 RepID=A0A5N6L592_9ROSI|nr:hypothetical protein FH972_026536 [Carpinus fangiana]
MHEAGIGVLCPAGAIVVAVSFETVEAAAAEAEGTSAHAMTINNDSATYSTLADKEEDEQGCNEPARLLPNLLTHWIGISLVSVGCSAQGE